MATKLEKHILGISTMIRNSRKLKHEVDIMKYRKTSSGEGHTREQSILLPLNLQCPVFSTARPMEELPLSSSFFPLYLFIYLFECFLVCFLLYLSITIYSPSTFFHTTHPTPPQSPHCCLSP